MARRFGIVISAVALAVGGCTPGSYAGIPLAPGGAEPELQSLAQRARSGDKHAQLELGIRYEQGDGVPINLARAQRLYAMAGSTSGGTMFVWVPAVREGGRGQVMPVYMGPTQPGLPEARKRLRELSARRAQDDDRPAE